MTLSANAIKILIADDNDSDRLLLSAFVTKLGHQTVLAKDGEQAIELFGKEHPHIILLDALMPIKNGFEAAVEIKRLAGKTFVPIIFLTSLTDAESLAEGLEAGGDDFLSKPYNHVILKAKIDAFNRMRINHHDLQKALEDLKQSQDRLVQREKMASLGELVAGVAHEINTPLGVGITANSFLKDEVTLLHNRYQQEKLTKEVLNDFLVTAQESVNITQLNLKRAAALINSFKQVAVDQSNNNTRAIQLRQYLDEIILSLHPQLKTVRHNIELDCSSDIECTCDAGALSQVITNLIMNSIIHAFEGIEIGHILIQISQIGETIKLVYSDDGVGMGQGVLDKIFEPFFTTKRGQGGCGLGAHIVYNQVNQKLDGQLKIQSKPGEGVSYEIEFPKEAKTV